MYEVIHMTGAESKAIRDVTGGDMEILDVHKRQLVITSFREFSVLLKLLHAKMPPDERCAMAYRSLMRKLYGCALRVKGVA